MLKILGISAAALLLVTGGIWGSSYNAFQRRDQQVQKRERIVVSCYQKRDDLFANIAAIAEKALATETGAQKEIAAMRSNALKLPDNPTPEQIEAYNKSQSAMREAVRVVIERYPTFAAIGNMKMLQTQVKNTEEQCAMARKLYIEEIAGFNANVHSFPTNIVANHHGIKEKPQMKFDNEESLKRSPRLFKKEESK